MPVNVPVGGKLLLSGGLVNFFFFFNDTATTEIYTLSLHDALPICSSPPRDATLLAGSVLGGTGLIQLDGGCGRLGTRVNYRPSHIPHNGFCLRLIVPGTYTVRAANQSLVGTLESAAVVITSNATLT